MKLVFITLKNQSWKVIKLLVLLLLLLSTLYMYHTLNDISKNEIYCNTGFIVLSEFLENIWNFQISFHTPRKPWDFLIILEAQHCHAPRKEEKGESFGKKNRL